MVTENALIKRINRRLMHTGQRLRKSRVLLHRGSEVYFHPNLGEYYIIDIYRNALVSAHVNLEALGRELGLLVEELSRS